MIVTAKWVNVAIFMHCVFGVYMYGNQETFPSNADFGVDVDELTAKMGDDMLLFKWAGNFIVRMLSGGGLPYALVCVVICVYLVLMLLKGLLGSTIGVYIKCVALTCGCAKQNVTADGDNAEDNVFWPEAKESMEERARERIRPIFPSSTLLF